MEVFAVKIWDVNTLSFKFETQPVISTDTLNVTLAGVSTSAKQDTSNTSLASIDGKITAVNTGAVTVSFIVTGQGKTLLFVAISQSGVGTTQQGSS